MNVVGLVQSKTGLLVVIKIQVVSKPVRKSHSKSPIDTEGDVQAMLATKQLKFIDEL